MMSEFSTVNPGLLVAFANKKMFVPMLGGPPTPSDEPDKIRLLQPAGAMVTVVASNVLVFDVWERVNPLVIVAADCRTDGVVPSDQSPVVSHFALVVAIQLFVASAALAVGIKAGQTRIKNKNFGLISRHPSGVCTAVALRVSEPLCGATRAMR
jgi:hypothetical protein